MRAKVRLVSRLYPSGTAPPESRPLPPFQAGSSAVSGGRTELAGRLCDRIRGVLHQRKTQKTPLPIRLATSNWCTTSERADLRTHSLTPCENGEF